MAIRRPEDAEQENKDATPLYVRWGVQLEALVQDEARAQGRPLASYVRITMARQALDDRKKRLAAEKRATR